MAKKVAHGGRRTGAGRKSLDPSAKAFPLTVTVPPELLEQLDKLRAKQGWNRSQAVTEAIRRLLGKKS